MGLFKPGPQPRWIRISLFVLAVLTLLAAYLFQRTNWLQIVVSSPHHPYFFFIVNKTIRLVVNDLACFVLIYVLFQNTRYLQLAMMVFLFELLVLLPVYFLVKLSLEGDSEISSPLLSQIHRLIVNPTLMILLMLGLFYQRTISSRKGS